MSVLVQSVVNVVGCAAIPSVVAAAIAMREPNWSLTKLCAARAAPLPIIYMTVGAFAALAIGPAYGANSDRVIAAVAEILMISSGIFLVGFLPSLVAAWTLRRRAQQ